VTLDDLISESTSGRQIDSFTNEEYKKVSTEETDPEIKEILKDYSNAIKDASNYFVR
jgi:2,4-dienoyl-CoA reductase-like NADH-dependent reductase (Old Yellow Enzyme family)